VILNLVVAAFLSIGIYFRQPLPKLPNKTKPKNSISKSKTRPIQISQTRAIVDLLVLTISAGMTIPQAIKSTAEICEYDFAKLLNNAVKHHLLGGNLSSALNNLAAEDRYWKLTINQLKQSWDHGSMILENLSELSSYLLDLEKSQTMKKVKSAGVRSVLPLGLCFLPAFILVVVVPLVASLIPN
jgi:pilus assembly protein TadC